MYKVSDFNVVKMFCQDPELILGDVSRLESAHITCGRWMPVCFNFCKRSLDSPGFILTLLDIKVTYLNHRVVYVNMHSHFTTFATFHKICIIFL